MNYEGLTILRGYKTNKNDVVKEFYIPVLKQSVLYKRAVGFFSSTALIELSKGISGLVRNGGKIKFIVSPLLSAEDIEAINKGYEARDILQEALIREFREPQNNSEAERLGWLSQLISIGILEIKVAFTPPQKVSGMYHEKIGVLYDGNGNKIAFTGSMNETINAFHNNYESIVVFNSLVATDTQRVIDLENDFDSLWAGREKNITVLDFPKIVRDRLKPYENYSSKGKDEQLQQFEQEDLLELQPIQVGTPAIPKGVSLHEYQTDAIDTWVKNDFRGIFDMATGTGKTYTGLGAAVKLYNIKHRLAVIIVAPYQHLVDQWVEDIVRFNMRPIIGYSSSPQKDWKKRLTDAVFDYQQLGIIDTLCFVTTNATFSSRFVQNTLNDLGSETLLIIDEAHNFGSGHLSLSLNPKFEYRLALSATLERHGDPVGTQILKSYFGSKCIEYDLNRAIREGKLTPYYYHPVLVYLEEDELEKYKDLSYKISLYFTKEDVRAIAEKSKSLNPLMAAFEKELDKMVMNYSYKPLLLLSLLRNSDYSEKVENVINFYFEYYKNRTKNGLQPEKSDSSFVQHPNDRFAARRTILRYPAGVFAKKAFVVYEKSSDTLSLSPLLINGNNRFSKEYVTRRCYELLDTYYCNLNKNIY